MNEARFDHPDATVTRAAQHPLVGSPATQAQAGRAGEAGARSAVRHALLPIVLMLTTPPAVVLLWVDARYLGGSVKGLLTADGLSTVVERFPLPSATAVGMIAAFVCFEAALLRLLPGRTHLGPVTPAGLRPSYRVNGVAAWAVTHAAFLGLSFGLGLFPASIVYDRLGELLITMSLSCLAFCAWLYHRGRHLPVTADSGPTGNAVMDLFWGVELHPTVLGMSLKQLVNCRVAMMGWSLIVISCAARQGADLGHVTSGMAVCAAIQLCYILKFFVWETGYFGTLDVMHDRFGYYLCWGITTWLPCVYTLSSQVSVVHPVSLPTWSTVGLLILGLGAIAVNYAADRQRQRVRESGGRARVWGRRPRLIPVTYVTGDGETRENILLASGWWGLARHFHYVPELLIAVSWTLATGFGSFLPYLYPLFLAMLLLDRVGRDDRRCHAKYGSGWEEYRRAVPRRLLPGVY